MMATVDSTHHGPAASDLATVLCVTPFEADHVFFEHAFRHSNWKVHAVRSAREALEWLRHSPAPVVLCEESLPDATWKDLLADVVSMPDNPVLIVTSHLADDVLWAEVLNLGAYDLLMKPFDTTEVFRVVSLAWRHWKNNWEKARAGDKALGIARVRATPA
jgi:DNA-binding NtrC family response regulator